MARELSSITRMGLTEPFELQVGRGQITGHVPVHKFGAVPTLSNNTTGTVWDINDTIYPWATWDSSGATIITLTRASASDAGKIVRVEGLDAAGAPTFASVTLSAESGNATTQTFTRVFRAYLTSGNNVGIIDIYNGATIVAQINAGLGQTLMAIYTVPTGYTGYLLQGTASCQASGDGTINMFGRFPDSGVLPFRIAHTLEVSGAGGQYMYKFAIPLMLPAGTDLDIRATTRSNNTRFTAALDILLIKDSF